MRILLIAGHGDGDVGAVGNGYQEADLTREFANLISKHLLKYAVVDIADTSKNWYKHLIKQGNYFNFKPYNYVLEIHLNAKKKELESDGQTKGTEIYVTTSEKSTNVEGKILKGITDMGFKNRGIKSKNYALIQYVKKQGVSSALLEVCFIDDIDDMKLYTAKKNEIAAAVAKGIADGFGLSVIKETPAEVKEQPSAWSAAAFNKATAKGILDGSNPQGTVTREMLAVVLDRLGLLDK